MVTAKLSNETTQEYQVHLRKDPNSSSYAREIHPFTLTCSPVEIYERIAELEAFSQLASLSFNFYAVRIHHGQDSMVTDTDEHTYLPNEEREKINCFLPKKLKMGKEELEGLVDQHFVHQGITGYIG